MRVKTYHSYVADLLDQPEVQRLATISNHHFRRDRWAHSYAVGKLSYRLARFFHANVTVAARAGLLHDLYHEYQPHFKKYIRPDMHHFRKSVEAAEKFGESPEVLHAIRTHMWPFGRKLPKTREAWIVWGADNLVYLADWWQSAKFTIFRRRPTHTTPHPHA